jgi:hypothetical protein
MDSHYFFKTNNNKKETNNSKLKNKNLKLLIIFRDESLPILEINPK